MAPFEGAKSFGKSSLNLHKLEKGKLKSIFGAGMKKRAGLVLVKLVRRMIQYIRPVGERVCWFESLIIG